jgi:hypothetical protein
MSEQTRTTKESAEQWKGMYESACADRYIYEDALKRISKMLPNGPGAGNVAREALRDAENN